MAPVGTEMEHSSTTSNLDETTAVSDSASDKTAASNSSSSDFSAVPTTDSQNASEPLPSLVNATASSAEPQGRRDVAKWLSDVEELLQRTEQLQSASPPSTVETHSARSHKLSKKVSWRDESGSEGGSRLHETVVRPGQSASHVGDAWAEVWGRVSEASDEEKSDTRASSSEGTGSVTEDGGRQATAAAELRSISASLEGLFDGSTANRRSSAAAPFHLSTSPLSSSVIALEQGPQAAVTAVTSPIKSQLAGMMQDLDALTDHLYSWKKRGSPKSASVAVTATSTLSHVEHAPPPGGPGSQASTADSLHPTPVGSSLGISISNLPRAPPPPHLGTSVLEQYQPPLSSSGHPQYGSSVPMSTEVSQVVREAGTLRDAVRALEEHTAAAARREASALARELQAMDSAGQYHAATAQLQQLASTFASALVQAAAGAHEGDGSSYTSPTRGSSRPSLSRSQLFSRIQGMLAQMSVTQGPASDLLRDVRLQSKHEEAEEVDTADGPGQEGERGRQEERGDDEDDNPSLYAHLPWASGSSLNATMLPEAHSSVKARKQERAAQITAALARGVPAAELTRTLTASVMDLKTAIATPPSEDNGEGGEGQDTASSGPVAVHPALASTHSPSSSSASPGRSDSVSPTPQAPTASPSLPGLQDVSSSLHWQGWNVELDNVMAEYERRQKVASGSPSNGGKTTLNYLSYLAMPRTSPPPAPASAQYTGSGPSESRGRERRRRRRSAAAQPFGTHEWTVRVPVAGSAGAASGTAAVMGAGPGPGSSRSSVTGSTSPSLPLRKSRSPSPRRQAGYGAALLSEIMEVQGAGDTIGGAASTDSRASPPAAPPLSASSPSGSVPRARQTGPDLSRGRTARDPYGLDSRHVPYSR